MIKIERVDKGRTRYSEGMRWKLIANSNTLYFTDLALVELKILVTEAIELFESDSTIESWVDGKIERRS